MQGTTPSIPQLLASRRPMSFRLSSGAKGRLVYCAAELAAEMTRHTRLPAGLVCTGSGLCVMGRGRNTYTNAHSGSIHRWSFRTGPCRCRLLARNLITFVSSCTLSRRSRAHTLSVIRLLRKRGSLSLTRPPTPVFKAHPSSVAVKPYTSVFAPIMSTINDLWD